MVLGLKLWLRWTLLTAAVGGVLGPMMFMGVFVVISIDTGVVTWPGPDWPTNLQTFLVGGTLTGVLAGSLLGFGGGLAMVGFAAQHLRQGRWSPGATRWLRYAAIGSIAFTAAIVAPIIGSGLSEPAAAMFIGVFALCLAPTVAHMATRSQRRVLITIIHR